MNSDQYLDQLFELAKSSKPVYPFEETAGHFISGVAASSSIPGMLAQWGKILFWSGILVVSTAVAVWVNSLSKGPIPPLEVQFIPNRTESQIPEVIIPDSSKSKNAPDNLSPTIEDNLDAKKQQPPLTMPVLDLPFRDLRVEPFIYPIRQYQILIITKIDSNVLERTFTITENTKVSEFQNIQFMAQAAGININYRVHDEKKKKKKNKQKDKKKSKKKDHEYLIRDFEIHMTIPGTHQKSSYVVAVASGMSFEVNIGWIENENGEAIELLQGFIHDRRHE